MFLMQSGFYIMTHTGEGGRLPLHRVETVSIGRFIVHVKQTGSINKNGLTDVLLRLINDLTSVSVSRSKLDRYWFWPGVAPPPPPQGLTSQSQRGLARWTSSRRQSGWRRRWAEEDTVRVLVPTTP